YGVRLGLELLDLVRRRGRSRLSVVWLSLMWHRVRRARAWLGEDDFGPHDRIGALLLLILRYYSNAFLRASAANATLEELGEVQHAEDLAAGHRDLLPITHLAVADAREVAFAARIERREVDRLSRLTELVVVASHCRVGYQTGDRKPKSKH